MIESALPHVGGRDIAIWGTREKGVLAKTVLAALGRECRFFVSSRPKTDTYCGIPLYTPEILDVQKHYVIVTTGAEEVRQFLNRTGFEWLNKRD